MYPWYRRASRRYPRPTSRKLAVQVCARTRTSYTIEARRNAPHLDVVPAATLLLRLLRRESAIGSQFESANVLQDGMIGIVGISFPIADGGIDGGVNDGLIEIDDEGELAFFA